MTTMRDGVLHSRFEDDNYLQENELHQVSSNLLEQGLTANNEGLVNKMNAKSENVASKGNEVIAED